MREAIYTNLRLRYVILIFNIALTTKRRAKARLLLNLEFKTTDSR